MTKDLLTLELEKFLLEKFTSGKDQLEGLKESKHDEIKIAFNVFPQRKLKFSERRRYNTCVINAAGAVLDQVLEQQDFYVVATAKQPNYHYVVLAKRKVEKDGNNQG